MAYTPITGQISFSDINTALGRASNTSFSLGDTLVRQLTNQLSGSINMNNAHASAYIGSTTTNVNLLSTFGSPSTVTSYKALIPSGVTVGATSGNTALTVGQFASGSSIVINNYGAIQAYGGGSSSSGGDAINANYPNQTVTINNQTGATIYGGGGGGGRGGNGGSGGSGGQGYYVNITYSFYFCRCSCNPYGTATLWGDVYGSSCCGTTYNSFVYINGTLEFCVGSLTGYASSPHNGYYRGTLHQVLVNPTFYSVGTASNVYTSGGSGGAGGAGGSGGLGQGYGQTNTAGSAGSAGASGSAGGTNAGAGGSGGTGGSGGAGGTWGVTGTSGNAGATGNTGASGNYTGGSAGSAGSGGSAGGSAGRYLVKGSNSVTLNNSGTVLGGLA